jgi:two-component system OmpR family sensor kinase
LRRHERESFIKSFLIFFLTLEVLLGVIAFSYYHDRVKGIEEKLFLEMKNYSFTLEGERFGVAIVPAGSDETFALHEDAEEYYGFFPIPFVEDQQLKIIYPKARLQPLLDKEKQRVTLIFTAASVVTALFALFYSLYSMGPLRRALGLLEEFLKDMVHDLNTPVTSILLNTRLLRKGMEEARLVRIEQSARTIGALHQNLASYLNDLPMQKSLTSLAPLVSERVAYYAALYPGLTFNETLDESSAEVNRDALIRILDNLFSNASKYNKTDGSVTVNLTDKVLTVQDTGIGIKEPAKAFERFYKEGERGLGIGLHIVKKLCDEMGVVITLQSTSNGTTFTLTLP